MKDISEWKTACSLFCPKITEQAVAGSIGMFNQGKIKYFCLKFKIRGIPFSVDFILKNTFKEFITDFDIYLNRKVYKVSPTKQVPYFLFGRAPNTIRIEKENIPSKGMYMIYSPYGIISDNHFYCGILLGKFLTGYNILWDRHGIVHDADRFCRIGITKIKDINHENNMHEVLKSLTKYNLLPKSHIRKQNQKYKEEFNKMCPKHDKINIRNELGLSPRVIGIYNETYELFPPDTGKPELQYVRRTWIFPHHLNIMLKIVSKMCVKYKGDKEICSLTVILHDTGLVYGRTSASPEDHEERSVEYATGILKKYGYDEEITGQVLKCITVTNSDAAPTSINEKIVRTADALSKFTSCHFIAKAAFSKDIDGYMGWMYKKLKQSYQKICFADEKKDAEGAYKYLIQAAELYQQQKGERLWD
ncbi:MAG: HD domain-containing protein [Nanoarchaeota archaeon]|nr:HD domain-containing protein [Nanoarchaeota archaeon]